MIEDCQLGTFYSDLKKCLNKNLCTFMALLILIINNSTSALVFCKVLLMLICITLVEC